MNDRCRCQRRPGAARASLAAAAAGVVYVEFLLAFFPLLVTFLGLLQLALITSARLVVQHAASRAARAAVVVLDDDPERHDGTARGALDDRAQQQTTAPDAASAALSRLLRVPQGSGARALSRRGGPRLDAIRTAAYLPLAVLAPSPALFGERLGLSLDDLGNGVRFVLGMLLYNRGAAIVTLREAPGSEVVPMSVPSDGEVTAHVTYLYYCAMPFADRFLCDSPAELALENIGDELRRAESPELLIPLALGGARFRVLSAEATLPNQGACYYPGSSCYGGGDAQGRRR
jgi:TadE-like protein